MQDAFLVPGGPGFRNQLVLLCPAVLEILGHFRAILKFQNIPLFQFEATAWGKVSLACPGSPRGPWWLLKLLRPGCQSWSSNFTECRFSSGCQCVPHTNLTPFGGFYTFPSSQRAGHHALALSRWSRVRRPKDTRPERGGSFPPCLSVVLVSSLPPGNDPAPVKSQEENKIFSWAPRSKSHLESWSPRQGRKSAP